MNNKHNKLLHYVLIMLLMLAPLRSVYAMQVMACDDMQMDMQASASTLSAQHCPHMTAGGESARSKAAPAPAPVFKAQLFNGCCHDNGACMSDCHFTMSVSLFMQQAEYSAILFIAETIEADPDSLVVRELNPPFRPPLSLS